MIDVITLGLDPGHSSRDPGCFNADFVEHDWVWSICSLVTNLLYDSGWPLDLKLSRTGPDHDPTRAERAKSMASTERSNKADFVISLHANSTQDQREHGCLAFRIMGTPYTWVPAESFLKSMNRQGDYVEEGTGIVKPMRSQMHCAKANHWTERAYSVLKHYPQYSIPAVLFEFGYSSNTDERGWLLSDEGKKTCALATVESVRGLLGDLKVLN
jgi:N-acetylmuramoyl-L-alanine amidase